MDKTLSSNIYVTEPGKIGHLNTTKIIDFFGFVLL